MVALNLSRAFDTVNIGIFMKIILETTLPPIIKRWLGNYLSGRQIQKGLTRSSARRSIVTYIIQPIHFSIPPEVIKLITYADDCTLLSSITNIDEICSKLNCFFLVVHNWFVSNQLEISPEKSTATLFIIWTKEVKTQPLEINCQTFPNTWSYV